MSCSVVGLRLQDNKLPLMSKAPAQLQRLHRVSAHGSKTRRRATWVVTWVMRAVREAGPFGAPEDVAVRFEGWCGGSASKHQKSQDLERSILDI